MWVQPAAGGAAGGEGDGQLGFLRNNAQFQVRPTRGWDAKDPFESLLKRLLNVS